MQSCLLLLIALGGTFQSGFTVKPQNVCNSVGRLSRGLTESFYSEPICALIKNNSLQTEAGRLKAEREANSEYLLAKWAPIDYNPSELLGNEKLSEFLTWLDKDANADAILKVFTYVSSLDVPLCVAQTMLDALSQNNALLAKVHARIRARLLAALEANESAENWPAGRIVYVFGAKGVQVMKFDAALQCEQSLEQPKAVLQLVWEIYKAIRGQNQDQIEFYALLEVTFDHLETVGRDTAVDDYLSSLIAIFSEKWREIQADMEPSNALERLKEVQDDVKRDLKKFGGKLKSLAVWMFAPTYVEDLIEVILYLVPWIKPISISRSLLAIFGVDKLFEGAAERMGAKLIYNGANVKFVMWWFGPNGLVPLFMRKGAKTDDPMPVYVDKDGVPFKQKVVAWKGGVEEEMAFLKKLVEQTITHKGHPFQELVEHTIANLHKLEHKVDAKWDKIEAKFEKFGQRVVAKWERIKDDGFQALMRKMGTDLKKFAVWLITPDRLVKLFSLALSLTPFQVPIFLTLEVLEAIDVTDLLIKEFGVMDAALQKHVKAFRAGTKLDKAVQFAIGKEGVLPLFLEMSNSNANNERLRVLKDEASLIQVFINVVFKHQANGLEQLFGLLKNKLELKPLLLEVFQRWNLWNNKLQAEFGAVYAQFVQNRRKKRVLDLQWEHLEHMNRPLTSSDFALNWPNAKRHVQRLFTYENPFLHAQDTGAGGEVENKLLFDKYSLFTVTKDKGERGVIV